MDKVVVRMCALMLILYVFGVSTFVYADSSIDNARHLDITIEQISKNAHNLDDELFLIGAVKECKIVTLNNQKYSTFPQFEDAIVANDNIHKMCNTIISDMAKEYDLLPFSVGTWSDYYSAIAKYEDYVDRQYYKGEIDNNEFIEKESEIDTIYNYFDIAENELENKRIVAICKTLNNRVIDSDMTIWGLEQLELALPYSESINNIKLTADGNEEITAVGNNKFDVDLGVTYAKKYGAAPNQYDYGFCDSGDCTNFTSQIKNNGGVPLYKKYNENGAWSYYKHVAGNKRQLYYSVNWCRAKAFAKYFGIKSKYKKGKGENKYKGFERLSKAVKRGSFIGFDKTGDGDIDHNAFVTALYHKNEKTRRKISYEGVTYLDFKISQHSKNYHDWVSSDKVGWKSLPGKNSNVVYAIIK